MTERRKMKGEKPKAARSQSPIEIVLSPRRSSTEAWRGLRAAIAALTDTDLDAAADLERLSRRRPEVLQALRAERRKRAGKQPPHDEPTQVEAIL